MSVVTSSVFKFIKESFSVLYWIGAWTLLIPGNDANTNVSLTCFICGSVGLFTSIFIEEKKLQL
jgi:hypothetical protein